jgi:hypothetical protein
MGGKCCGWGRPDEGCQYCHDREELPDHVQTARAKLREVGLPTDIIGVVCPSQIEVVEEHGNDRLVSVATGGLPRTIEVRGGVATVGSVLRLA